MKTIMPLIFILTALAIVLSSCSTTASPALTPSLSPTPFGKYSQALMDVPYCSMGGQPQKMDVYFPNSGGP